MRPNASVAVVLVAALVVPAAALGHGPCACLEPRLAEAGKRVRIASYPAYRIVFNPRPQDFGIAPGYLASAYRADVATTTVLERPRRRAMRPARFGVPPRTPPGVYLVLIFDGSEGGAHNSWEYLHVVDLERMDRGVIARAAGAATATERDDGARDLAGWAAAAAATLALLVAVVARRRGRD